MAAQGDKQLREALRRWRAARPGGSREVEVSPGCVYGALVRDDVADLAADVEDVKAELRWVRTTIIATIVAAAAGTVLRLAGWQF
jgi:hypothetical protein